MRGFLKFLLLLLVRFVALLVLGAVLTAIVYALSLFSIGRWFLSIINDGYTGEVVTMLAQAGAYAACLILANKLRAFRPYRALCIVGSAFAVYVIASSIRYNEPLMSYLITLVISLIFFVKSKEWIE